MLLERIKVGDTYRFDERAREVTVLGKRRIAGRIMVLVRDGNFTGWVRPESLVAPERLPYKDS